MKINYVLADYFREHRQLPLPGLGIIMPKEKQNSKSKHDQEFEFSKEIDEEANTELVAYVQKVTGKMTSLAESDIESVVLDGKQMLNIHQPFILEGIGVLEKDQYGQIHFQPYTHLSHRYHHEEVERKDEEVAILPSANKKPLLWPVVAGALVIAILAWFFFLRPDSTSSDQPIANNNPIVSTDKDSSNLKSDSKFTNTTPPVGGSSAISYRIVFETSPNPRATDRYQQLKSWGHNVVMEPAAKDGYYKLAIPFNTAPSDTAAMKDSISTQYGRQVYLEFVK